MTDLQSRIAALSPERRELLERRLSELVAARGATDGERITPRDRSRPTPLGIAQQREWAVERVRGANNITGAFQVEGALDLDLLSTVLTEVIERHEVLRSTVEIDGAGMPMQVVHDVTRVPIPVVDLTHLAADEQKEEVRRRFAAEVTRSFAPDDPRRLRVALLRLAEQDHYALFSTDHAASDAWSMAVIVREIAALYEMHRSGGPPLPPPAIQFGDYAAWQRERMGQERTAAEVRHWKETLGGIDVGQALPADRPYPARPTFTGALRFVDLTPVQTADLRRFGDGEGVSLIMVLLAATAVLLHRYLERDDLVIGSLASGRNRLATEELIGCFANPLPLRVRVRDDQTLREVVHAARETMTTALDHQDVPFDKLIEALGLGREASQKSLSGIWINALTGPDMTLELPDLRITGRRIDFNIVSVDLTLVALPLENHLQLQWHFMTELFDPATVAVFADQFHTVLVQMLTEPDTTVGQVRLAVTPPTAAPEPVDVSDETFVELFARQVALAPDAPAVVCDGESTSYAALDREADRLAHRLRALGVGRDTPVGILVGRSPRLAVAILGVLKAGGLYVPLDPAYPQDRIAFMLADARAAVLVTEQAAADRLRDAGVALPDLVLLDGAGPRAGGDDTDHPPAGGPEPDAPAYAVYTSGSTGRPKGAVIEHRSLARFAREVADRLALGPDDRFLQFASPSFDVLVEELFPTWLAGGAVVVPTQHIISGQVDLADLVERERLTVMELPTAYWHEWVRELDRLGRTLPECLRLVIIGGERVLPERLAMWRRLNVPLLHVYGLTETTVSSTFFRVDPAEAARDWPNLPIGTPLPSADLRVLDSRLRPTPVGGIGELYIGGVSLARGYLHRPGLTAQRFVADPDPGRPGRRLYRTGDLVRQRADGNLEFISRVDTQIKIRGFRVEPTEIESTLSRHPEVGEAVVTLYEPAPGDRRLAAYVVARPGRSPAVADLRQFLERELPAYMVPSAFVTLDALPLNSNGKVDRDRLPSPGEERPEPGEAPTRPQSATQQTLADIMSAVVGVSRIGIHDNFFEVGGDSILAIQVVARAQEAGLKLTAYDLFVHPTVADLAAVAASGVAIDAEQGEIAGPLVLSPAQRRFCRARYAEPHRWTTSVLVELGARVEAGVVARGVDRVLGHHDGLRQRFLLAGERTRARIAPSGDETPFEEHDLSGLDEADRSARLHELVDRMREGLNLATGPLLRVALFRLGADRRDRLAVVAHRLVADAASLRLVLEDLETAVVQLSAGEELRLLPKTTSWKSWCRRLEAYAGTEEVRGQRHYWSALVDGPTGELPDDLPVPAEPDTEADTRVVAVGLDRAETEGLARAAEAFDATVEELLLAALGRTLSDWTGSARHLVDLERHDRPQLFDEVDLSRTVGWFSRTHPLALTSGPDSPPEAAVHDVRAALRAVPTAGTGWELLRRGPDPLPDPPVRIGFSYRGADLRAAAFTVVEQPVGTDRGPLIPRPYPIEVEAAAAGGRLEVRWRHSARRHRPETVRRLAEHHLAQLRAYVAVTASAFPLARVDRDQLTDLLGRL